MNDSNETSSIEYVGLMAKARMREDSLEKAYTLRVRGNVGNLCWYGNVFYMYNVQAKCSFEYEPITWKDALAYIRAR